MDLINFQTQFAFETTHTTHKQNQKEKKTKMNTTTQTETVNKTSAEIKAFNELNSAAIEAGLMTLQVQSPAAAAAELKAAAAAEASAKAKAKEDARNLKLKNIVIAAGGNTSSFELRPYYANTGSIFRTGQLKGFRLTWGFDGGANYPLNTQGFLNWEKIEAKIIEVVNSQKEVRLADAAKAAKLAAGTADLGEILTAHNKAMGTHNKAEANGDGTFRLFNDRFVENFRRTGGHWSQETVHSAVTAAQIAALTEAKLAYAAAVKAILAK